MPLPERRDFLQTAAAGAAALAFTPPTSAADSRKIVVGVIGPGGMGSNHVSNLVKRPDVEIAYVCDVDKNRSANAAKAVEKTSKKASKAVGDMRKVLDDKAVDAVFIATPDHWHAPAAILALDAGKHVYVEKPCRHNIREGRLMADAVKRSGKVLQVGTQSRSGAAGQRGDASASRRARSATSWSPRPGTASSAGTIGKVKPSDPPAHLDYDTWCGPAPLVPYRSNLLPGIWRWWYDFGCGDIGNDGVHDIDVAVWGLGATTHPVAGDLPGRQVLLRRRPGVPGHAVRGLRVPGRGQAGRPQAAHLRAAHLVAVRAGGLRERGRVLRHQGDADHRPLGRLEAVRRAEQADRREDRRGRPARPPQELLRLHPRATPSELNADVMAGHLSATIVHLANIGARTGQGARVRPEDGNDHERRRRRTPWCKRKYRDHWGTPKGV